MEVALKAQKSTTNKQPYENWAPVPPCSLQHTFEMYKENDLSKCVLFMLRTFNFLLKMLYVCNVSIVGPVGDRAKVNMV